LFIIVFDGSRKDEKLGKTVFCPSAVAFWHSGLSPSLIVDSLTVNNNNNNNNKLIINQ
jgi:hypothetical protein